MLILIKTRYIAPTATKPARVKAQLLTGHGRQLAQNAATIAWHDYDDTADSCPHNRAVKALIVKLKAQQGPHGLDPYTLQGAAGLALEWHRSGADNPTGYTYATISGFPCITTEA